MVSPAFAAALSMVLVNEGGYVANAADKGGPTQRGISTPTLTAWRATKGLPPATAADVKALTLAETSEIYRTLYWAKISGDAINSTSIATVLMDVAVLNGPGYAAKAAQTVCNALRCPPPLLVDGLLGPKSVAAINSCTPKTFVLQMVNLLMARYVAIAEADPTQRVFLLGWCRRAASLATLAA